jgi:hypothetical protein
MNFFETVKTIVAMLPMVIEAVNTVEKLFPEGGKGAAKLEMVKSMLVAANDHAKKVDDFEAFWPVISKTIAGVVAFMKVGKK